MAKYNPCPLCGKKAKRYCPVFKKDICSYCCASKRNDSIKCLPECKHNLSGTANYQRWLEFEKKWGGVFCGDVNFSKEKTDIRSVLEPARLQHITTLILWNNKNPNSNWSDDIKQYVKHSILTWINKNPFLIGPHYISVLECALRIQVFALLICSNNLSNDELKVVLRAAYQHAWWIDKRFSLYPVPGNHAAGESLGLTISGLMFEQLPEGKRWLQKGLGILKQEIFRQINSDGGPIEASIHYHGFLIDLFWFAFKLIEQNKNEYFPEIYRRLKSGDQFLANFCFKNNCELFSDGDNGYAIAPGVHIKREKKIKTDENFRNYHESGYTVIQFKNSWKLLFDHGPLGMPPLYDHGHADVLSFILSYNGEQFLIDPGTFRYFGINNHRTYFRSTSAHNTVEIDCQDQAKQISNFIWDKPYNCREKVVNHGDKFVLSAIHDGYRHLKKSVLHDRCIEIDETSIKIIDSFSGTGEHIFRMHMHFHPEADIKAGKDCYVISKNNKKIIIRCKNCNKIEAFKGSQIPFLGWCAPQYGQLIQCHTLRITKTGKPEDIFFNTEIAKR